MQPEWCLACPGESTATSVRPGPHFDLLAVVEDMEALRRCGVEASVEGVEQRTVHARRRIDETRGIGQVPGPLLVDVHLRRGKGAGDVADAAGVVEVDVGHGDTGQLRRTDPDLVRARRASTGTDVWLPVSIRTGAGPSIR